MQFAESDSTFHRKSHALVSGRAVYVCVFEGEIRQVALLRLQRAHVFILLSQVTKGKLTDPALVFVCTCVFQQIQRTCSCLFVGVK